MDINFRNVITWVFSTILIYFGFVRRAINKSMKGDYILSVFFHKPEKREFENCVKWLIKKKFKFLKASDLEKIIQNQLPFPKGAVFLSVDDGWQSNEQNIIAVAEKYHIPVTIFISTEPVEEGAYWWSYLREAKRKKIELPEKNILKKMPNDERLKLINSLKEKVEVKREALTIEQVKKAAESEYITIGAHTHSHPILIKCSDHQAFSELKICKVKLEEWIKEEVAFFAYPNGDFGIREEKMLSQLNYRLAFSNNGKLLTKKEIKQNYRIPRVGYLEGASFAENICRMVGIWKPLTLKVKKNILNVTVQ